MRRRANEDLESGLVWGPVFLAMLFASQIPWRHLIAPVVCMIGMVPLVYLSVLTPDRQAGIDSAWHRMTHPADK